MKILNSALYSIVDHTNVFITISKRVWATYKVHIDGLGEHRLAFLFSHRPRKSARSEPVGYASEKERAIGAGRLCERKRARNRSRSAPLIISHAARSSILNDKKVYMQK